MPAPNPRLPLDEADRFRLARLCAEVGLPLAGHLLSDADGTALCPATLLAAVAGKPCNQSTRERIASARPFLPQLPADSAQKV